MSQNSYEFNVTVSGHTGSITALQFSPDCKFLASGSNHGVLLIFSTSSWRPLKRLIDASPITTIIWHETERYLLLCGCESGDLYFLHLAESLEIVTNSTSCFEGPIRSLSLSPATSTLAVGYGEDVSIARIKSNPYGLDDRRKLLPKPPSHAQSSAAGPSKRVPMSLYFFGENQLVVTYLDHGVVSWDLTMMVATITIPANACSIGRSVLCRDCNIVASSNLLDRVDWYSLSGSKLISSSKIPISKGFSASSLAYVDGDNTIVIGGLSGRAYIVSCQTFDIREELDHRDRRDIESVAFCSASGGKKLIATGAVESEGAAPISIWVSTLGGRNRLTLFTTRGNIDVTNVSWSGVLIYSALLFLCCAWVNHFLTAK